MSYDGSSVWGGESLGGGSEASSTSSYRRPITPEQLDEVLREKSTNGGNTKILMYALCWMGTDRDHVRSVVNRIAATRDLGELMELAREFLECTSAMEDPLGKRVAGVGDATKGVLLSRAIDRNKASAGIAKSTIMTARVMGYLNNLAARGSTEGFRTPSNALSSIGKSLLRKRGVAPDLDAIMGAAKEAVKARDELTLAVRNDSGFSSVGAGPKKIKLRVRVVWRFLMLAKMFVAVHVLSGHGRSLAAMSFLRGKLQGHSRVMQKKDCVLMPDHVDHLWRAIRALSKTPA